MTSARIGALAIAIALLIVGGASALTVHSPVPGESYNGSVPVNITADQDAESAGLAFDVDDRTEVCVDCTELHDVLTLAPGNYTLLAVQTIGNVTEDVSVDFSVVAAAVNETNNETGNQTVDDGTGTDEENGTEENETSEEEEARGNETDGDATGEPRFALGFQHLPQQVAAGNVSDAELAGIIRGNRLNPGVLNRLIRTGALGEESVDAIIETQETPPGIFRKVFGFFGIHIPTPKERLAERYDLRLEQKAALLADEDTQPAAVTRLRKEIAQEREILQRVRDIAEERREEALRKAQEAREREESRGNASDRGRPENVGRPDWAGDTESRSPPMPAISGARGNDVRDTQNAPPGRSEKDRGKSFDTGRQGRGRGR